MGYNWIISRMVKRSFNGINHDEYGNYEHGYGRTIGKLLILPSGNDFPIGNMAHLL